MVEVRVFVEPMPERSVAITRTGQITTVIVAEGIPLVPAIDMAQRLLTMEERDALRLSRGQGRVEDAPFPAGPDWRDTHTAEIVTVQSVASLGQGVTL
jgi:hypothetical protein